MKNTAIAMMLAMIAIFAGSIQAQITFDKASLNQLTLTNLQSKPVVFTENKGQFDDKILFKANANGAIFYFYHNMAVYVLIKDSNGIIDNEFDIYHKPPDRFDRPPNKREYLAIRAQFVDANPTPVVIGEDRLSYKNNYFYGNNPDGWKTNVPNYSSIIYKELYPGIDLKYYGDSNSLKYDFIIQTKADISQIKIRYAGVDNLSITANGSLKAATCFGNIIEDVPYIYQEIDGAKHEIDGQYTIKDSGVFGFDIIGGYNHEYPLIIDPKLVYSTFLGGLDWDESNSIAVDDGGCIYITGNTWCPDFPMFNPIDSTLDSIAIQDAFVTKFASNGASLIYSTYLGGYESESGYSITTDSDGNAYLTGKTSSPDFPMVNPFDGSHNGRDDVFVAKLSSMGDSLLYSTFLGGFDREQGRVIVLDQYSDIYITGYTNTTDFPTVNPYDASHNGRNDAFAAKFSASGDVLLYSTYLGGANPDYPYGMVIDNEGCAYIAGGTGSINFPTVNPYNENNNGLYDAFVVKLSSSGNSLLYSTYIGGDDDDIGWGIAIDSTGDIYFGGGTRSSNFPTVNPIDSSFNGYMDIFMSKLSASGDSLLYSTFLGGSMYDEVWGLVIDDNGNTYITGGTSSSEFPTTEDAYDASHNGSYDAFLAKLPASGDTLLYSTYLGGNDPDYGFDIALYNNENVYITGRTRSSDFPVKGAYDGTYNGYYDVYVIVFQVESNYKYLPGDANMFLGFWPPQVIGSDITYMVSYFRGITSNQPCLLNGFWASADVNGDCSVIGSDVIRLVNYFRGSGSIEYCPDYEPSWPPIPYDAPDGWPNCEISAARKIVPSKIPSR